MYWSNLAWGPRLKHVIEGKLKGKVEGSGRGGRRRKQLLDARKETIRYK